LRKEEHLVGLIKPHRKRTSKHLQNRSNGALFMIYPIPSNDWIHMMWRITFLFSNHHLLFDCWIEFSRCTRATRAESEGHVYGWISVCGKRCGYAMRLPHLSVSASLILELSYRGSIPRSPCNLRFIKRRLIILIFPPINHPASRNTGTQGYIAFQYHISIVSSNSS